MCVDLKAELLHLKANGGWCWFHSPRVIVAEDWVLFGTVAGTNRGASRAGDIELTAYHPAERRAQTATLWAHGRPDDHNVAAVLRLSDGTHIVSYQGHSEQMPEGGLIRWRKVTGLTPLMVTTENQCSAGAPATYSNLCQLRAEGHRIYAFHRGVGSNPNYSLSDDNGQSFRYGGRLLRWPRPTREDPRFTGRDGARPYVTYCSNSIDAVHFIASEDHPRAYDNSLYHGVFRNGIVYSTDGRPLGATTGPEGGVSPIDLTKLYLGSARSIAWPIELRLDPTQGLVALFSTRNNDRWTRRFQGFGRDHRYIIGRFDGDNWKVREICYAGSRLYAGEEDYTGLASLDPSDTRIVVISSNVEPSTGQRLRSATDGRQHWELFVGISAEAMQKVRWVALTKNSVADNIRPVIVSIGAHHSLVVWMRGRYSSYTDFDTDIVGTVYDRRALGVGA